MSAQQRFHHNLVASQTRCAEGHTKMPHLCVIGTHDFDELLGEVTRLELARELFERVNERVAVEWNPLASDYEHLDDFRDRVEQEEFASIQGDGSTPASSPAVAEAEASLDPRQRASMTEYFEFCGCKCFRALCEPRGFWFA